MAERDLTSRDTSPYRVLLEHSSDSLMVVDADGSILAMSPAARRLHGIDDAEEAAFSAAEYRQRFLPTAPDDAIPRTWPELLTVPSGEAPVMLRVPGEAGSRAVTLRSVPLSGEPPHRRYLVILAPATLEPGAVGENGRLLRTVIDALPIGVWFTDAAGRIVLGNDAGQRIWSGIRHVGPPDYAEYRGWWAGSGEPITSQEWGLARALKGEAALDEVIEIEAFDGQRKVIRNWALPLYNDTGQIMGAVALNEDITGEWRAKEQQERLAALIRSSSDAIIAKDRDGIITDWNPGAERIFGYSRSEAVGSPIGMIIPEDRAAEGAWLMELIAHGDVLEHHETERVRKDGSRVAVSLSLSPIRNALGRVIGAATISRDVTERRQAEAKLLEQAQALEAADRRKDTFIAILAHELRNPLSPISTAIELVRLQDDEGRYANVVQTVGRQLDQMRRLLDDLLDVSRMGRGLLRIDKLPVDIADVVEQAVETARPRIDKQHQSLEIRVPDDSIMVQGDLQRLVQVLVNLLTNAAKYTEPGGHVTLTCEASDDAVTVSVRDTGKGIPRHMLERIFDLFNHPELMENSPDGLGLGLTLCRYIVRAHQGTVQAFSPGPGAGAELVVTLPRLHTSASGFERGPA